MLPLPPLAEQKRIVSKVDELMALCDKLEARRQRKQEIQSKLNSAALDRMLSAEDQEEFEQHWQRICENFDVLYDNPENVEKLRQAILQLAVQGKLVPQNLEDEPASILIEKIEVEKKSLVRDKGFRASKSSLIQLTDIKYSLPNGWLLTKIGDLCLSIVPNRDKPKSFTGEIPWITLPDFDEKKIKTLDKKTLVGLSDSEIIEYNARIIPSGSVIMSCVGRFGLVAVIDQDIVANQQIHGFIVPNSLGAKYIAYAIKAQKQYLESVAQSTTILYLNKARCESIPIPLPPLTEQKRIVEKVEQLMGLCDELEAKLRKERIDSEKLMETVVKGLLEGADTEKTELEKPIPLQVATIKLK